MICDCRIYYPDPGTQELAIRYCPKHAAAEDLRTALETCANFISTWKDCLSGVQMSEADFKAQSGLREARAIIAKTTEGQP